MPAFTGMCGISAGCTGSFGNRNFVFMFMLAVKLGNFFFFLITAFGAGQRQNTIFFFGGFLGDFSCAKSVGFFIQLHRTTFSAENPVAVRIMFYFAVTCNTVISFTAEMLCPFPACRTDSVTAAKIFRHFGTAVFAQFTVGAGVSAVFAYAAFDTDRRTVCAYLAAFAAKVGTAALTVSAVGAHRSCTVLTNAAVGAEQIKTFGTFSAVLASGIGTVHADQTAFVTDFCAVAALSAFLTPAVFSRTFPAEIAGSAEFIGAFRAFFAALGTEIRAFLASVAADTGDNAVSAFLTVGAEGIRSGTVHADSAVKTDFVRAVFAGFGTFFAQNGTFGTSLSAGTDIGRTVNTDAAGSAEIAVSCTVCTDAAAGTNLIRAVFALFKAFLADNGAVHAAASAEADFHAVFADAAFCAVIAFAAHAFETNTAF